MRKHTNLLALLLVLAMMVSLFAACSKAQETVQETAQAAQETAEAAAEAVQETAQAAAETVQETAEAAAETVEETAEAAAETVEEASEPAPEAEAPAEPAPADEPPAEPEPEPEPEVLGPEAYYLADEPTEISFTFQYMFWFASMFDSWGNSPFWPALEEATNTRFTFNELQNTAYSEKVNLMIAGGDTTDIISGLASVYAGGLQSAIDEETIYDVVPYLDYAPLYKAKLYEDPEEAYSVTNLDGTQGAVYALLEESTGITGSSWIRTDWLEGVGMDVPTDTESLYQVLKAFHDTYHCDAALYQNADVSRTVGIPVDNVWNAFGPLQWYLDDGEIKYGWVQPHTLDYLQYLRKLADEGLFLTSEYTGQTTKDMMAQNQTGVFGDNISTIVNNMALMDPGVTVQAMAAIGEPTEYGTKSSIVQGDGATSIFTTCQFPELVMKLFNYLYTEPGALLANYGIEGLSFEYDDSGEPKYTDLIINNPDDIPVDAALGYYTDKNFLPALMDGFRTYYSYTDFQREAPDIWASAYTGTSGTLPAFKFTTEENDALTNPTSDMNTYITEQVNKFVFGDLEPSQENFDAFVQAMQSWLPQIEEIYNQAYDRYLETN